jgi:hypothetical protein
MLVAKLDEKHEVLASAGNAARGAASLAGVDASVDANVD